MTQEKVRIAFIGAGKQANWRHYPSVVNQPDTELVAVCDFDEAKAQETAKRWGAPKTYTRYEQMYDELNPDAVYIIMGPTVVHEPVAYALRHGLNVFMEKPPGVTLNQVQLLAYLAETNSSINLVGFQRRFLPAMTELKARVEARGPIHTVSVANLKSTRDLTRPGSNGVLDTFTSDGMHAVDHLRWLGGGDVVGVHSSVRRLHAPAPGANQVMAQVEFASGAVGQLHYGLLTGGHPLGEGATAPGIFRAEIHGTNVSAYVDAERSSYIVTDCQEPEVFESRSFAGDLGTENPNHWLGFWHESRHFIDSVKAKRQTTASLSEAVKSWELIHKIYAASGLSV